jgi:hypothetical protein
MPTTATKMSRSTLTSRWLFAYRLKKINVAQVAIPARVSSTKVKGFRASSIKASSIKATLKLEDIRDGHPKVMLEAQVSNSADHHLITVHLLSNTREGSSNLVARRSRVDTEDLLRVDHRVKDKARAATTTVAKVLSRSSKATSFKGKHTTQASRPVLKEDCDFLQTFMFST